MRERAVRRRPRRGRGDRLHRRRHGRVPRRRGRPVLLPRDEHPAAGRAPGHRVHDRPRPRRAAARTSPTAGALDAEAADDRTGTRSRRGSTPRTRPPAGSRRAARCTASTSRASTSSSAVGTGAGRLRLDTGVETAAVVGIHYDPMLAKVIAWAPTRDAGRRARSPPRSPAPRDPRRRHQPRPARERPAPPGVPRRRHRHRVLRPARARRARRPARRADERLSPRSPPRWRSTPATARPRRCCAASRPAGATSSASPQRIDARRTRDGRATGYTRDGLVAEASTTSTLVRVAPPTEVVLDVRRRAARVRGRPSRRRRLRSTHRSGAVRLRRRAALRRPGRAGRARLAARADARLGRRASPSRSATRSAPGSRSCGSRR